jgi:hypothetical protein
MIKTSALNTIEVQRKVSAVLRAALYHVDTLLLRNGVICFPFQRIARLRPYGLRRGEPQFSKLEGVSLTNWWSILPC